MPVQVHGGALRQANVQLRPATADRHIPVGVEQLRTGCLQRVDRVREVGGRHDHVEVTTRPKRRLRIDALGEYGTLHQQPRQPRRRERSVDRSEIGHGPQLLHRGRRSVALQPGHRNASVRVSRAGASQRTMEVGRDLMVACRAQHSSDAAVVVARLQMRPASQHPPRSRARRARSMGNGP
jgi:hypothetical protein